MLYHFLYPLKDIWFGFNVFRYITFRAAMAAFTAFIISLVIGPIIIKWLKKMNVGQSIRKEHVEDLHKLHSHKEGTPTMGGVLILFSVVISMLLWARLDNIFIIISFITLIWFGILGFIDDYIKLIKKDNQGLSASVKFVGQIVFALILGIFLYKSSIFPNTVIMPFFKNIVWNLGIFYILFVVIVVVGSSNAVNITDGLDGLAIGCVTIVALTFAVMSYITGNVKISEYLNIYYISGGGELSVVCAALVGAGLGFLWFNCHPASVFMGDTGSLALGWNNRGNKCFN